MSEDFIYESTSGSSIYYVQQDKKDNRWTVIRQRVAEGRRGKRNPVRGRCHNPSWARWFDTKLEAQYYLDDYADAHGYILISN